MSPVLSRRGLVQAAGAALGAAALPAIAEAVHPDADLVGLIARHGEAEEACRRAEAASDAAFVAFLTAVPPRPEALRWRPGDFVGTAIGHGLSDRGEGDARWYAERGVGWMREKPAAEWFAGAWTPTTLARWEERRQQIIGAWGDDQAARKAVSIATGYEAATEAVDAAANLVVSLACEVKRARPRSLSGLRALAAWFAQQDAEGAAHDDALALFAGAVASFGGAS